MDWFGMYRNHTPITEELAAYIRRVTLREPAHGAHREPPLHGCWPPGGRSRSLVLRLSLLILVAGFVMRLEQIAAEIAVEVAPDRVYVVGGVLGHVEFDHKRGRLHSVIMRGARLRASRPGEPLVAAGLIDLVHAPLGDVVGQVVRVEFRQRP